MIARTKRRSDDSRARYIPLPALLSSPDLLSVAAHCHFRADRRINARNISESISLSLSSPSPRVPSRENGTRVRYFRNRSRRVVSYRNIAPNLETEGSKARSVIHVRGLARYIHSAEEHCCPATIYCLLCGIVDRRRRIQYSRTNGEWPFLRDGNPSFSATDVVGPIHLDVGARNHLG